MHEEEFPSAPLEPKGAGDSLRPHEPRHHSPRFDDPVSWSVAVLRLGSITVRLHAVMLATILVLLLRSAWFQGESGGVLGPGFSLVMVVFFFWVPLFEEMVLLGSIRRLGGSASEEQRKLGMYVYQSGIGLGRLASHHFFLHLVPIDNLGSTHAT